MVYGLNQSNNISYRGNANAAAGAGAVKDVLPQNIAQKLPDGVQNFSAADTAKESVKESTFYRILASVGLDPKALGVTGGLWAAFILARDGLDKKLGGKWSNSWLGKISKFGDTVTGLTDKIIPAPVKKATGSVGKTLKNGANWAMEKSAILRSWKNTPLIFENSMAKSQANGIGGFVSNDTREFLNEFTKNNDGYLGQIFGNLKGVIQDPAEYKIFRQQLKDVGANAAHNAQEAITKDKSILADIVAKMLKVSPKNAMENATEEVLEKAGKEYVSQVVKSVKNKTIAEKLAPIFELPNENKPAIEKIIERLNRSGDTKITVKSGTHLPFLNLHVTMGELANKLKGTLKIFKKGDNIAGKEVSKLGKSLPGFCAAATEGLTSVFAGKKIGPLMAAVFLATSFKRAMEAPKGKKLSTFMDEETTAAAMLVTMPLQTKLLAKAGGALKYVGMGKTGAEQLKNREAYRAAVKKLNDMVTKDPDMSFGVYKTLKQEAKTLLKGKTHFWQKPLKFIGKIIGSGFEAETIKPYAVKGGGFGRQLLNLVNKGIYKFKVGVNVGGKQHVGASGFMRAVIVLLAVTPFLQKPIRFVTNKLFGKPYDKEKEQSEALAKEKETKQRNAQELIQKHPEIVDNLKNYPDLIAQIQQNPNALVDILNDPKMLEILQKPQNADQTKPNTVKHSQALDRFLSGKQDQGQNILKAMPNQSLAQPQQGQLGQVAQQPQNIIPQYNQAQLNQGQMNPYSTPQTSNNALQNPLPKAPKPEIQPSQMQQQNVQTVNEPQRFYVPSSKPSELAFQKGQGQVTDQNVQNALSKAEKAEAAAMKYL